MEPCLELAAAVFTSAAGSCRRGRIDLELAFDVVTALSYDGLAEFGGEIGGACDAVDAAGFAVAQGGFEILLEGAGHAGHQVAAEVLEVDVEQVPWGGLSQSCERVGGHGCQGVEPVLQGFSQQRPVFGVLGQEGTQPGVDVEAETVDVQVVAGGEDLAVVLVVEQECL